MSVEPILFARNVPGDGSCGYYAAAKGLIANLLQDKFSITSENAMLTDNRNKFLEITYKVIQSHPQYKNEQTVNSFESLKEMLKTNETDAMTLMAHALHAWQLYILASPERREHIQASYLDKIKENSALTDKISALASQNDDKKLTKACKQLVDLLGENNRTLSEDLPEVIEIILDQSKSEQPEIANILTKINMEITGCDVICDRLADLHGIGLNTECINDVYPGAIGYFKLLKRFDLEKKDKSTDYTNYIVDHSRTLMTDGRYYADQYTLASCCYSLGITLNILHTYRKLTSSHEEQKEEYIKLLTESLLKDYEGKPITEENKQSLVSRYKDHFAEQKQANDNKVSQILAVDYRSNFMCSDITVKQEEASIVLALALSDTMQPQKNCGGGTEKNGNHFLTLLDKDSNDEYKQHYPNSNPPHPVIPLDVKKLADLATNNYKSLTKNTNSNFSSQVSKGTKSTKQNFSTSIKNFLASCIKAVNRFYISIRTTLTSILTHLKKALPTILPKAVSVKAVGSSQLHRPNAKDRAATDSTYSHTTPTKSLKV